VPTQDGSDFQRFVNAFDLADSAACEHLRIDLGAAACAVLERDADGAWQPQPDQ